MSRAPLTGTVDRFPSANGPDRGPGSERGPDPTGFLEELGVSSGTALADVACGGGHVTLAAAEMVAPAPVYAVDADGTLLDELDVRALERGIENVTTISGDPGALSERLPERVDAVLVVDAFSGIESTGRFAEQASRSLRPGGRFIVVNRRDRPPEEAAIDQELPGPPAPLGMTPEETRRPVESAGFEIVRNVDLPPDHYGLVFERAHDR